MEKGLGVKFRKLNNVLPLKGYKAESLKVGSPVVVETDRGIEYGWIVSNVSEKGRHAGSDMRLRKVLRYANEKDQETAAGLVHKECEIGRTAAAKAKEHSLPVKIIQAELLFDESKVIIYYKMLENKKDFSNKQLVKDISTSINKKVDMKSVSPREEARIISGIGPCGRHLCCTSFLDEFPHVSVKVLKEQGIQVNQSKVCGLCGKFLCCLKYEYEGKL